MTLRPRLSVFPWALLGAAVVLGLVEADHRIDVVRRGYRVEALRVVRERLREDERVLRIDLAGEQRAAEARARVRAQAPASPETPEAGTPARSDQ
jgi:hypothetical protein